MVEISLYNSGSETWDAYVSRHPRASVYHLHAFRSVVEKTYGHKCYYFSAHDGMQLVGVLPFFHINSLFLGNALVSLPFCDYGGILADTEEVSCALFNKAAEFIHNKGCAYGELRQTYRIPVPESVLRQFSTAAYTEKVRMTLYLPASEEALFSSFPAKLRSQIRKPQKEGCTVRIGGRELLDDFYSVFAYNMRDLGSPVHSKKMILTMLDSFGVNARIFVVYHTTIPVACSFAIGFKDTLVNPWASFNRTYGKIAPNMLLYWEMLRYAITGGYRCFDFGRSTVDEGTYKFKTQWGAQPQQLYWYRINMTNDSADDASDGKKKLFVKIWRLLPLPVTKVVGPVIRKHLHL